MAVGFALAWLVVPTVGKRVFLLAVSTIPTVMRGMTTAAATVKKAALGRKKRPPLAVKKQLLIGRPFTAIQKTSFQLSPRGWSSFLLCLRWLRGTPSPWGRSGWGLWVDLVVGRWALLWGITAPLAVCATRVTHAMSPMAISLSAMGIAATLLTTIPTRAIITAGS